MNSSHFFDSLLKKYFVKKPLHGPLIDGKPHGSIKIKLKIKINYDLL